MRYISCRREPRASSLLSTKCYVLSYQHDLVPPPPIGAAGRGGEKRLEVRAKAQPELAIKEQARAFVAWQRALTRQAVLNLRPGANFGASCGSRFSEAAAVGCGQRCRESQGGALPGRIWEWASRHVAGSQSSRTSAGAQCRYAGQCNNCASAWQRQ